MTLDLTSLVGGAVGGGIGAAVVVLLAGRAFEASLSALLKREVELYSARYGFAHEFLAKYMSARLDAYQELLMLLVQAVQKLESGSYVEAEKTINSLGDSIEKNALFISREVGHKFRTVRDSLGEATSKLSKGEEVEVSDLNAKIESAVAILEGDLRTATLEKIFSVAVSVSK